MSELIDSVRALATAFGVLAVVWAGLKVTNEAMELRERIDERRAVRDALEERVRLDSLLPSAPDGTVPPESLAAGRAALHTAITTPDTDTLRNLVGTIDWPETEDPR